MKFAYKHSTCQLRSASFDNLRLRCLGFCCLLCCRDQLFGKGGATYHLISRLMLIVVCCVPWVGLEFASCAVSVYGT